MASVKSVEPGNNCFSVNHNIRYRSKLSPLGISKSVLVLISDDDLKLGENGKTHKMPHFHHFLN